MIMASDNQSVFFMHIAKTAGSYLNRAFELTFGDERVSSFSESRLRNHEDVVEFLQRGVRVFSGHLYDALWDELGGKIKKVKFTKVTIIRNPIEQIASHILWLDHYNREEFREEYKRFPEPTQRLIDLIDRVDLRDIGHIDHFLTNLPSRGIQLLDNYQSRFFLCGPGRVTPDYAPLSMYFRHELREKVGGFNLILRNDQVDKGIDKLSELIGHQLKKPSGRVNEAKSLRNIDINNTDVIGVLGKRVLLDRWLWRYICSKGFFMENL
jgi:hypothetical protein